MNADAQQAAIRQLDSIRILKENAEEEYGQYLRAYEEDFGAKARELYEEAYV